jgi:deoxyribodipyrimidine photo-lyase
LYKKLNTIESNNSIRQLIWREFYYNIGYYYNVFNQAFREKYNNIKWSSDNNLFILWCDGKTGYPIVDAIMRQLNQTGYISNRARLITSSFLVKNLAQNWLKGEKYFAQKLIDYDPLVNNGNWQWVAGTGTDSQPYFRIFNPWRQSKEYDNECDFIKSWIPELKNIDNKKIHNWDKFYDEKIYIKPIVDYTISKNNILSIYRNID